MSYGEDVNKILRNYRANHYSTDDAVDLIIKKSIEMIDIRIFNIKQCKILSERNNTFSFFSKNKKELGEMVAQIAELEFLKGLFHNIKDIKE